MNAEQYDAMMLETATAALAFAREENWRGVHDTLLACGGASSIFDTAYASATTAHYGYGVHQSRCDVFDRPLVETLEQFPRIADNMRRAAERCVSSLEWAIRRLSDRS